MKFQLIAFCFVSVATLMFKNQNQASGGLPEIGKAAPTFRLNDHTGNLVKVGGPDERWRVLAFYPKALTPG